MALLLFRKAFAAQCAGGGAFHLPESLIKLLFDSGRKLQHRGSALVLNHVGGQDADCRKRARGVRHNDSRDA